MTHAWDAIPQSNGFAKWESEGDSVKGEVVDVGIGQDLNGNDCPQIIVNTGDDTVTITAAQAMLRSKLLEARPNVGDTIAIVFTGVEKRTGGKTLKQFDVAVKSKGRTEPIDTPVGKVDSAAGRPSASDLI